MMDYHRQNNVDIRIARIFNCYGAKMLADDGRVVSNFIVQAIREAPLTIYGEGQQTRSFCYVDDLVDGLMRLMNTNDIHQPVNIGNPNEFTIKELAEAVIELTSSQSVLSYHPLPQDDPRQRKPDITKARELLGWEPRIPLREGLVKTIEYFRAALAAQ